MFGVVLFGCLIFVGVGVFSMRGDCFHSLSHTLLSNEDELLTHTLLVRCGTLLSNENELLTHTLLATCGTLLSNEAPTLLLGLLGHKKTAPFGAQFLIVGNCFAELLECCLGGRGLPGRAGGNWGLACEF